MSEKKTSKKAILLFDSSWEKIREIAAHRNLCNDDTQRYSRVRNRLLEEAIESLYRKEFSFDGVKNSDDSQSKKSNDLEEVKIILEEMRLIEYLNLSNQLRSKYLIAGVLTNIHNQDITILEAHKASKLSENEWKILSPLIQQTLESGLDLKTFCDDIFAPTEEIKAAAKRAEAKIGQTKKRRD